MSQDKKPVLFLRRASGLVRVWDPLDMYLFNFISAPLVTYGLWFALTGAFIPEGDQIMGWVISLVPFLAVCVIYAMAGVTMPHAGGEYLYISRTFGGSHGFSLSLVGSIWPQLFWGPVAGITVNYMVLTPISYYLGTVYGLTWLIALGQWLPTITGTMVVTLIFSSYTLFFDCLGMRIYHVVQRICSVFGYISLAVITGVFIYFSGQHDYFVANFNSLVQQNQGISNAYQVILDKAATAGFNATPNITLMGTFLVAPIAFLMYYAVLFGAPVIGEMKAADDVKKQMFTLAGPAIGVCIFAALTLWTNYAILGRGFFNAYSYLWQTNQSPVGLPPYYLSFFMILLKDQPIVVILTMIGYSLMNIVAWIPNLYIPPSRYMFAWSFDRIFPAKIAELKGRAHTPVYAFLSMFVATIIVLLLFSYTPFGGFTVSIGLAAAVMSLGVGFVAIYLPYKKKELWESSPASLYKIGGIPVMVIMGVISIVYLLALIIEYIVNPVYGLNNPLALGFLLALYIAAYIVYYFITWYRKRKGFDVSKVYGEIPSA